MQLPEVPACVRHMVHLQIGGHGQHARDNAWCQGQAGGVHEVEQQGDAGRVQAAGERHGPERLSAAATTALKHHPVGIQGVEKPAAQTQRGGFK